LFSLSLQFLVLFLGEIAVVYRQVVFWTKTRISTIERKRRNCSFTHMSAF